MALAIYWLLAFGLAWGITIPIALDVHGVTHFGIPQAAGFLIGVVPALAAFIAASTEGKIGELWARICHVRAPLWTYLASITLPLLFLGAPFALSMLAGTPAPKLQLSVGIAPFALAWFVLALGEEIGWRGYVLPKLMGPRAFLPAASILGAVWCVWHYPKLAGSPYLHDFSSALPWLAIFSVQIFFANLVICWLYQRSGRSVLVTTIFHTAFNLVATVYLFAAMDLAMTGAMAIATLLIVLLDPRPVGGSEKAG